MSQLIYFYVFGLCFIGHYSLINLPNRKNGRPIKKSAIGKELFTPWKHHNNEETNRILSKIHEKCPQQTLIYSIGQSAENKPMNVIEITKFPGKHELLRPEFKFVANMHGNEVVGKEILLRLAYYLCLQYNVDKDITWLIDNTRIHIMPTMNPDGYERAFESIPNDDTSERKDWLNGRANSNNVDLNRNFPNTQTWKDIDKLKSSSSLQPETMNIMEHSKLIPFVLSANLHGGSLVSNYPFDKMVDQSPFTDDDDIFKHLSKVYSMNNPRMSSKNSYWECSDLPEERFDDGITNGAQWYEINGSMQDYLYMSTNCFDITIETGCKKFPQSLDYENYWNENILSMLQFIYQVHRGIKGLIRDKNGQLLSDANISIDNRKKIIKSTKYGDYFRLLMPGIYNITVTKESYQPETKVITVTNESVSIVNFNLTPIRK